MLELINAMTDNPNPIAEPGPEAIDPAKLLDAHFDRLGERLTHRIESLFQTHESFQAWRFDRLEDRLIDPRRPEPEDAKTTAPAQESEQWAANVMGRLLVAEERIRSMNQKMVELSLQVAERLHKIEDRLNEALKAMDDEDDE